jgi:uncharacterized coiled-coil protein SlyX
MKPICFLLFTILISACGSSGSGPEMALMDETGSGASMEAKRSLANAPMPDQATPVMEKKVVKTGNLGFQVDDLQSSYKKIASTLEAYGAYIENESQSTYGDRSQYSMTIRVPIDQFDTLFSALAESSKFVENKSVNLRDVTEQYYDLETRLTNKKALEARYRELLEKANSVKDLLEIENSLNTIRTEIEQIQGQFDYLSKQVSYSTIHLNFYEILPYQYQPESRPGFMDRIKIAFTKGWTLFVAFLFGLVRLWPFILVLGTAGFLIIRRRKRKKR